MTYLLIFLLNIATILFACSADGAHVVDCVGSTHVPHHPSSHQGAPVQQYAALLVVVDWLKPRRI